MSAGERERPAFGALLRRLRLSAGLSQEALAERARISVQAVSALERGARTAPQRLTLQLIADGLALGADDRAALEAAALQSAKPRVRGGLGPLERALPQTLPAPPTSFLGRDREVASIAELLRDHRIVTIWGPGGVGKTRLAIAAASRVHDAFPDGTVFVELAPVVDAAGVPAALAASLGIRESVDVPIVDAIAAALANARVLIVFDNCEHVIDGCASLVERIVAAGDGARLLCTSREPLRIEGEHVAELDPLPSTAAIRLFVERAADRGVACGDEQRDLRAIATICRRLDGIPLAIELAAARLPALDAVQIAAGLDDRFRLLTRGSRTAPSRRQTLAGALDWSHDLLPATEKVVFRRAGVLIGSWTLDDAHAVVAAPGTERWATVDAIAALVDKALVAVTTDGADERRYRMLETTRAYALARLRDAGELAACERLRAERVRAVAQTALAASWEHRSEPRPLDVDNVRAALHWAIAQEHDVELGGSIAGMLAFFFDVLGLQVEGMRWTDAALELVNDGQTSATLWLGRSLLARRLHLRDEAYTSALRAVEVADGGAPEALRARARLALAYAAAGVERHAEGAERLVEAEAIFREAGDTAGTVATLHARAFAAFRAGRPADARDALERVAAVYRAQGATRMLTHGMIDLAEAEYGLGNRVAAIARAREGIDGARVLSAPQLLTVALSNLAAYLLDGGDAADAEEAAATARESCAVAFEQQFGVLTTIAIQVCALAGARRGATAAAARLAGYVELALTAAGAPRENTEQRVYDALLRELQAATSAEVLRSAFDAGTVLDEDDAVRLALDVTQPQPETLSPA
ncbi:MAG TPA: helix-turn-helix domain-containing protein [Candidatus Elarobacter sp.]|nr:helix-turn-helix domain-containing protein [Candidatus Elarobacter sp.]